MKLDDIDRILREEGAITPSPDFAARVMRSVRHEAAEAASLEFPWVRLVPGLVLCAALTTAGLIAGPPPIDPQALAGMLESVPFELVAAALTPLLGSYVLVRYSMRLAGYRR